MGQEAAAFPEQLLGARRQREPAAAPLEEFETQILFEGADLARQRGLRDVQHLRGL